MGANTANYVKCKSKDGSINHWYLYWPPNASDIAPGEILRQVSEPLVLVMSIGNKKKLYTKKIPTANRYLVFLFQISWYIFLVFYRCFLESRCKNLVEYWYFGQNKNLFGVWFLQVTFHWYRVGFGLKFSRKWHL